MNFDKQLDEIKQKMLNCALDIVEALKQKDKAKNVQELENCKTEIKKLLQNRDSLMKNYCYVLQLKWGKQNGI